MPEATSQQATKPLSYYLSPEYDIILRQAQDWLTHHEYKRTGSYVIAYKLDWKLAEDFGFFVEVPFKSTYQGPAVNNLFNTEELVKVNQPQTEWYFTIGKCANKYMFYISAFVPLCEFSKRYGQNLLECAKQKNGHYSGLWLNFDGNGNLVSGREIINGHGSSITIGSKKLPSTELEEIKREIYDDSFTSK